MPQIRPTDPSLSPPPKRLRARPLLLAALGLLALTPAAVLLAGGEAQAQKATTVRIGFFPNLTHAPALVAVQRGDFQKAFGKVKVEVREFASGPSLSEAFAAGSLDIGYVGPGPAINAAMRGLPVQIIAGASNAGAVLIARKGVTIASYKDLAGKKVGVPSLGNTQDISLRHVLADSNLKAQSDGGNVTVVPVAPADTAAAFASGQLDAALVPEPWGAQLEKLGNKVVGDEKTVWRSGDYPSAVVIVNTKFAADNPDLVKAFLQAHVNAVAFMQRSPAAAQAAISAELQTLTGQKLDPLVLQRALARTRLTTDVSADALAAYAELNRQAGYARGVPDLGKLLNLTLVRSLKPTGSAPAGAKATPSSPSTPSAPAGSK